MGDAKHTPGELGATGTMIMTPPPEEVMRQIKEQRRPVTSRRVAVCEPSPYMTDAECEANAAELARRWNAFPGLLAACQAALVTRACDRVTRDMLRAAIAAATAPPT